MTQTTTTTSTDAMATLRARAEALATRQSTAKRVKGGQDCHCGCGGRTRGGRFLPGHDAKALSRMLAEIRAAAATTPAESAA